MTAAHGVRSAADSRRSAAGRAEPGAPNTSGGFGAKEFVQGLVMGILVGFIIALIIVH